MGILFPSSVPTFSDHHRKNPEDFFFFFKIFFFLMWTIFKVFIGSVTILLLFYVLVFWP